MDCVDAGGRTPCGAPPLLEAGVGEEEEQVTDPTVGLVSPVAVMTVPGTVNIVVVVFIIIVLFFAIVVNDSKLNVFGTQGDLQRLVFLLLLRVLSLSIVRSEQTVHDLERNIFFHQIKSTQNLNFRESACCRKISKSRFIF